MKHSMKMMWSCVALIALAVILAVADVNVGYAALFVIPCMVMMGAMMWMMMGSWGGGSRGDQK